MAILSRDEMRAIIARGESVFHGEGIHKRIIAREEDLPSEAELATGDVDGLTAARAALVTRIAGLMSEIAAIDHDLATLAPEKASTALSTSDQTSGTLIVPPAKAAKAS